ncbi:MAG: ROK family protein [Caldisericota bacterium]|nr:ROK family protein [Caldisericota bacterium]
MKTKSFLGIDFGGTKINFVLLKNNEIFYKRRILTGKIASGDDIVRKILTGVTKIEQKTSILPSAIGIGLAGMVNHTSGQITFLPNIGKIKDFPIIEHLSKKISVPAFLENDVNTALLGEACIGAAQNKQNVVFVSVGTGIGGAILIAGRIYTGKKGLAGEIGHLTVQENGLLCNCGKRGCLETVASGKGIERYVTSEITKGKKTEMIDCKITAKKIAQFAKRGDKLALQAYDQASHYLGKICGNIINILNPEIIIFGGGVVESGLILRNTIRETKNYAMPSSLKDIKIVRSVLKNDAGAIGAAFLAKILKSKRDIYI